MLLRFPTPDALRLALTAAVIPREQAQSQVASALADDGTIWVDAAEDLPREAVKELKKWGVETRRGPGELRDRFELATCWLQLVPLVKSEELPITDKTPILFELRRGDELPELAAEILRLGNDRQSYRHLATENESRTLLRGLAPLITRCFERWETPRSGRRHSMNRPRELGCNLDTGIRWLRKFSLLLGNCCSSARRELGNRSPKGPFTKSTSNWSSSFPRQMCRGKRKNSIPASRSRCG